MDGMIIFTIVIVILSIAAAVIAVVVVNNKKSKRVYCPTGTPYPKPSQQALLKMINPPAPEAMGKTFIAYLGDDIGWVKGRPNPEWIADWTSGTLKDASFAYDNDTKTYMFDGSTRQWCPYRTYGETCKYKMCPGPLEVNGSYSYNNADKQCKAENPSSHCDAETGMCSS